jgi:HlyD family secretion protein
MKTVKILAMALVVLVLAGAAACSLANGQSGTDQQVPVTRGDLTVKVNGTAKAVYAKDAKLAFGTAGKVEIVAVKKGDAVTKGMVMANLDTSSLELSLSQEKTNEAQGQVVLIQSQVDLTKAQIALTQAQSGVSEAEAGLNTAQFNLDRTKAVSDIKDEITKIEWQIKIAEMRIQETLTLSDKSTADYWNLQILYYQRDLADQYTKLEDLLDNDEYTGEGALTYDIMGQTYDRLTVEDVRAKQLQVKIAEKSVEEAKQSAEQAKQSVELAGQNIEQAKRSLEQVQKNIAYNQKQIAESTIIAPFDGIVAELDVEGGDFIAAPGTASGTPIYLIDPNSLEISTEIDEIDVAGVKAGQKAIVNLDALPETGFQGTVTSISVTPVAKPQNSGLVVYEVKVGFSGAPPAEVKAGMSASVDVVTQEKKNVVLVLNKAIKRNIQGQTVVNIVVNQKVEERIVVLGLTDGTRTEVISGLQDGDIIVKLPANNNSNPG